MATTEDRIRFRFISAAMAEDTFTVVRFKGREGMSQLYEFDIILDAEDPEIDLKEVLKNPARLIIEREDSDDRVIHGIPARFEQLHEFSGHVYYRAVLVPRLWLSDLYHENQLFLDKTVPEIIEEILKQAALTSRDYEFKLTAEYPTWEYVCQYNETDFNFISRWMEREGIYYYFDQTDEGEKLIITDSSTAHKDIAGEARVRYSPPDSLIPNIREQIREFTCRQQVLPRKVILKDYNYRKPSLDLKGEADVDSEGRGNVYIYGEHFKTPEQGNALARIRAEELLCRETVYFGEGTVPPFLTGYIFELEDHYRDSCNRRYLITELTHEGVQANYLTGSSGQESEEIQTPSYFNRFVCIPDDVQFRPERRAVKPRLDSTLNARVDAAGDGQYAEIDDQGRYKIKLPFDQSDAGDGKASRWVRMAQPYAGADYGMHFPLHKGTEVVLTFVNGDPDRPIIAGTVPNPETSSPVKGGNQTQCMIRTGGGNEIKIEDNEGSQLVKMSTPTEGTYFRLGASNPGNPPGIDARTNGHWTSFIGSNQTIRILGDAFWIDGGNVDWTIESDKNEKVVGNSTKTHIGATSETFLGMKTSKKVALENEINLAIKNSLTVGLGVEAKFGGFFQRSPTSTTELNKALIEKNDKELKNITMSRKKISASIRVIKLMSSNISSLKEEVKSMKQNIKSLEQKINSAKIEVSGTYQLKAGSLSMKAGGRLGIGKNGSTLQGNPVNIKGSQVKIKGNALKIT